MEELLHHTYYDQLKIAPEEWPVVFSEHPLNPKARLFPCLNVSLPVNQANNEKLTQISFETFNNPAYRREFSVSEYRHAPRYRLMFTRQPVLCLYAADVVTGLSVDIGEGVISMAPIFDQHCPVGLLPNKWVCFEFNPLLLLQSHAVQRKNYGGGEATEYLQRRLNDTGYNFYNSAHTELIRYAQALITLVAH